MALADVLAELRSCEWVDLTHAFRPGIPRYHAFPDEQREVLFDYPDGFLVHEYRHIGQWGTHMDPPSHFAEGGRAIDQVPVTEMILPLAVIDIRAQAAADPDFAATDETVRADEAAHGTIPESAFVAMLTGWGARWPDREAMRNTGADGVDHYPGWDASALRFVVEQRGAVAVGHDTTDTDPGAVLSAGQTPAETFILHADRWQIELLANLDRVPARGALIVATWPKPQGGSGFPARCFAIVPAQ